MPSVAVHCKASISDGMGHIYRQINLANELKKQGWDVSFYIPNFAPAIDLLTQTGFTSVIMAPEPSVAKHLDNFFDFLVFLLIIRNTAAEIKSIGIILFKISFESWLTSSVPAPDPKNDRNTKNLIFFSFNRLFL